MNLLVGNLHHLNRQVESKSLSSTQATRVKGGQAWYPVEAMGWQSALDQLGDRINDGANSAGGWPLPPPHIFNLAGRGPRLHNWLRIRKWGIRVAFAPTDSNVLMSPEQWKLALNGQYFALNDLRSLLPDVDLPVSIEEFKKLPPHP